MNVGDLDEHLDTKLQYIDTVCKALCSLYPELADGCAFRQYESKYDNDPVRRSQAWADAWQLHNQTVHNL